MSGELEETYGKLLGRPPSDEERIRLQRVKDTLGIANNDALWLVLLTWESYDGRFREFPEKIAEETRKVLEDVRRTVAVVAENETRKAHRALADSVAKTAGEIAGKKVDASRWQAWALAAACMVLFGAVCMVAGYGMGRGEVPFWSKTSGSAVTRIASAVLATPAGWMVFALVLPIAFYGVRSGWTNARDEEAKTSEKIVAWAMVGVSVLGTLASLVMLLKVSSIL